MWLTDVVEIMSSLHRLRLSARLFRRRRATRRSLSPLPFPLSLDHFWKALHGDSPVLYHIALPTRSNDIIHAHRKSRERHGSIKASAANVPTCLHVVVHSSTGFALHRVCICICIAVPACRACLLTRSPRIPPRAVTTRTSLENSRNTTTYYYCTVNLLTSDSPSSIPDHDTRESTQPVAPFSPDSHGRWLLHASVSHQTSGPTYSTNAICRQVVRSSMVPVVCRIIARHLRLLLSEDLTFFEHPSRQSPSSSVAGWLGNTGAAGRPRCIASCRAAFCVREFSFERGSRFSVVEACSRYET